MPIRAAWPRPPTGDPLSASSQPTSGSRKLRNWLAALPAVPLTPPKPLQPAQFELRADGSLYSTQYDDVFASSAGALAQAQHVFLAGNGLPARWREAESFVVLETGFGTGLNFLATWAAWRETAPLCARLHFISVEKHPLRHADLAQVLSARPQLADLARAFLARYPPALPGFHRVRLDSGRVRLTLLFGEVVESLRQLQARVDAFYLDGFAPAKNPAMWSDAVFVELARLANADATAATYSVAGEIRDGLARAGFAVERAPGFGPKHQMLMAHYTRAAAAARPFPLRHAAVIGAGLAGTACAAHLAERGWRVDLVERRGAPGQGASGNPTGLLMPAFALDWNPPTRLTVPGFLYALQYLEDVNATGAASLQRGVLQLARDPAHAERQRRIVETYRLPPSLVECVGRERGSALAGQAVAESGWWFPAAGWVDPAAVCRNYVAAAGANVACHFNREIRRIERIDGQWRLYDNADVPITAAPLLVLANAHAARELPGLQQLALSVSRGQVTLFAQRPARPLLAAVCREGFVTPALHGWHCVGASYAADDYGEQVDLQDHLGNLERLQRLLPQFAAGIDPAQLHGRVGLRTISPDRLPLVGQYAPGGSIGEPPALLTCLALASRGLTWAPLLGELLACMAGGEPLPLERDLVRLLSPQRFAPAT